MFSGGGGVGFSGSVFFVFRFPVVRREILEGAAGAKEADEVVVGVTDGSTDGLTDVGIDGRTDGSGGGTDGRGEGGAVGLTDGMVDKDDVVGAIAHERRDDRLV